MEHLTIVIGISILILLAMCCLHLGEIKRNIHETKSTKSPGPKTGIIQTLTGRVFTVRAKKKAVYNDDYTAWKREKQEAGDIPYDEE